MMFAQQAQSLQSFQPPPSAQQQQQSQSSQQPQMNTAQQPFPHGACAFQHRQQSQPGAQQQQLSCQAPCATQLQQLQQQHQQQQRAMEIMELRRKLAYLCACIQQRYGASLAMFQAWLASRDINSSDLIVRTEPCLGAVADADFSQFRFQSCQARLSHKDGLAPRVCRTGAVQVVQSLRIIPPSIHPRTLLGDHEMARLAEVLYVPIFDQTRPGWGPVAVLEVFISARAPESTLMADFISVVAASLVPLGLSVSSPLPQPVRKSALTGRRARVPDSVEDMPREPPKAAEPASAAGQAVQAVQQQGGDVTADEPAQHQQAANVGMRGCSDVSASVGSSASMPPCLPTQTFSDSDEHVRDGCVSPDFAADQMRRLDTLRLECSGRQRKVRKTEGCGGGGGMQRSKSLHQVALAGAQEDDDDME